jgi:hypothetical protein
MPDLLCKALMSYKDLSIVSDRSCCVAEVTVSTA